MIQSLPFFRSSNSSESAMLEFYCVPGSPPCAVVSLLFSELGIEPTKTHSIDMLANEHLKPEVVKINPQHIFPTIVDEGFILWESRAIAKYLASKHGSKLYPDDLKARALVDQRLDFDLGTLYAKLGNYYYAPFYSEPRSEKNLAILHEAFGFLNMFLEGSKYAAGDELTLADFSLAVTVSIAEASDISVEKYSNIVRWHSLVKATIPTYNEVIGKYVKEYIKFFEDFSKMSNIQ